MKTARIKKTICAALAGLMLTMTACTEAAPEQPTRSEPAETAATEQKNIPDAPKAMSVQPLSSVTLQKTETEPNGTFYSAYNDYAAELFRQSCMQDIEDGKNAMISPESVMMALGMAANGAKGETLSQMETALGGLGIDDLNDAMQYHMNKLTDSEDVSFNVANSVWVRDDAQRIQMKQEFYDKVKEKYNADSFLAPFDNGTKDDINNWVSNNTNGMIPELIDDIPAAAVSYIINAIAFEAGWAQDYEDYQINENDKFKNSKGKNENVTMMYSEENSYFEDDDVTGFLKYYKGGDYAFMAILPKKKGGLADFVSDLDGEKINKLWANCGGEVKVCIPEFSFDYDNELSDELKAMGMELPFTENADLSGMAETGTGELYFSRVIHKTHIDVDRYGTKAAAATAIELTDGAIAMPEETKEVYLNRPFAYAIIDTNSGMPVFIGAVNTVNGQ